VGADKPDDGTESELRQLRERIERVESGISSAKESSSRLTEELRETEVRIGENAGRIKRLAAEVARKKDRLHGLRKEEAGHRSKLDAERTILAGQIRASYQMGRQDYLKILLNQQDPYAVSRCLTYYNYLARARTRQIEGVLQRLERVRSLGAAIDEEARGLEQLRRRRLAESEQFNAGRETRERIARLKQLSDAAFSTTGPICTGFSESMRAAVSTQPRHPSRHTSNPPLPRSQVASK